jgi:hypothetical protein
MACFRHRRIDLPGGSNRQEGWAASPLHDTVIDRELSQDERASRACSIAHLKRQMKSKS